MIQLPIKLFFIREIMKVKRSTVYGTSTIPWVMNQNPDYNLDVFTRSTRNFITSLVILVLFIYACIKIKVKIKGSGLVKVKIKGSGLVISLFISPPNFFNIKKDRLYSISSRIDVINCS